MHIRTMQYESAKIFRQILVFMTVTSNSPNFLPANFSRYTVLTILFLQCRNSQLHALCVWLVKGALIKFIV